MGRSTPRIYLDHYSTAESKLARILHFCKEKDGCLIWTRSVIKDHAQIVFRKKSWIGSRVVWTLVNGEIPEKKVIMHLCGNGLCLNPDHLELGTQKDNLCYWRDTGL